MIDDVEALLGGDFGDDRILRQIRRACRNGEVVSNYERSYVRDLAEKHLRARPAPEPARPAPDVEIPAPRPAPAPRARRPGRRLPRPRLLAALAALALVAAAGAALAPGYEPPQRAPALTVSTDEASYGPADLILVEGTSGGAGAVSVVISGADGAAVWSEELRAGAGGAYSAVTVADPAWGGPGTYTVTAGSGSESASSEFEFTG